MNHHRAIAVLFSFDATSNNLINLGGNEICLVGGNGALVQNNIKLKTLGDKEKWVLDQLIITLSHPMLVNKMNDKDHQQGVVQFTYSVVLFEIDIPQTCIQ